MRKLYSNNFEKPTLTISPAVKRNRAMNPTTSEISKKVQRNRCSELFALSEVINGASTTNKEPAVDGLIGTLAQKCGAITLVDKLFSSKLCIKNAMTRKSLT